MDRVLVVGSLNMDFAVYMDRRPQAGETVMARSMKLVPGARVQIRRMPWGSWGQRLL